MTREQPTPAELHPTNRSCGREKVKTRSSLPVLSANAHNLFVLSVDLHRNMGEREREGGIHWKGKDMKERGQEFIMNNKPKTEADRFEKHRQLRCL